MSWLSHSAWTRSSCVCATTRIDQSTGRDWRVNPCEMLRRRGRAIRLVAMQSATGRNARWPLVNRMGHGNGAISGATPSRRREGAHVSRR
jgi:hypothetical protein